MKSLIWLVIGALVVGGAWYLFRGLEDPPSATLSSEEREPLNVGALLPLSGEGANYGVPIQNAGKLAADQINAAGGIAGRQLVVIWEDGKCDAKEAEAAANKLISVDKVRYILGGVCSSEVLAGAPLAESSTVIWISPAATSPEITEAGDHLFRTAISDALAGKVAAQYAYHTLKAKTAAVISENKTYAQELRKAFKEEFVRLGGVVKADETYKEGDTSFKTQIAKIKTAKPDVLYLLPQTATSGLLVMKQLREQKVTAQLLTAEALAGKDTVKDNAALLEGLVGIEPYFNDAAPMAQAFMDAYKKRFDEEPAFPSAMANYYSGYYLLKEAIEKAGDDPEAVKDWLYSVNGWEHALGTLAFDANGDRVPQYQVLEVQKGTVTPLEIIVPAGAATSSTP